MRKPNLENYAAARVLIAAGRWHVDPVNGVVYGSDGAPFHTLSWGYVQIRFRSEPGRRRLVLAHRVVWEYAHEPLTEVLTINHLNGVRNDNRLVNLEAVTEQENNLHALRTGLVQMGEQSSNAKLTEEQVREIYQRAWAGEFQPALGVEFGISSQAVSNIKQGQTWAYVTGHENRRQRPTRMTAAQ